MGENNKESNMVYDGSTGNGISTYMHPASAPMTYSRLFDVTDAMHLGDGPLCVETTPQHASTLSANLGGPTSWVNNEMWVKTDEDESCSARGYSVQIDNPYYMGTIIKTGAWFMQ